MSPRFAAFFALVSWASAHAESLMVTQPADVLAAGACQVEAQNRQVVDRYDRFGGGRQTARDSDPSLALWCGLDGRTQLGLRYQRQSPAGDPIDRLSLQGRTAIWQSDDRASTLALVYGVTGERTRYASGYRTDPTWDDRSLGLAFTQRFGEQHRVHVNFSGGVWLPRGTDTLQRWGTAYEFAATPTLSLLAEAHGQSGAGSWRGLGLRWTPAPAWDLGLMAARQMGSAPWGTNLRTHELKFSTAYRF